MPSERSSFDPSRMAAGADVKQTTVSQLNRMIKNVLSAHLPGTIHLVGEISNYTRAGSGHLYLTLKDDQSEVRAVMWRSDASRVKFDLKDGLEVIATGSVDVYEPRGQVQFYVRKLEPRGVGALELAFRQLQERLQKEGLFDPAHKKPLPKYPRTIAVVTSPVGAAIRDILTTIKRRFPCVKVLLYPVKVQGEGAAEEIAVAIGRLNKQSSALGGVDVMIVGRGGGSLEDLWAFNEEPVARAIFASRIPIISAVGHEVDVTIADLVADLRAPTPTAAAELAVPVLVEVIDSLDAHRLRVVRTARHALDLARSRLQTVQRSALIRDPFMLIRQAAQQLDDARAAIGVCAVRRAGQVRTTLHDAQMRLAGLHPATGLRQHAKTLAALERRLAHGATAHLRSDARRSTKARSRLRPPMLHRQMARDMGRLVQARQTLNRLVEHRHRFAAAALDALLRRLQATHYTKTLERGFSVTRTKRGRKLVSDPKVLTPGDRLLTETAGGEIESRVVDTNQKELFET